MPPLHLRLRPDSLSRQIGGGLGLHFIKCIREIFLLQLDTALRIRVDGVVQQRLGQVLHPVHFLFDPVQQILRLRPVGEPAVFQDLGIQKDRCQRRAEIMGHLRHHRLVLPLQFLLPDRLLAEGAAHVVQILGQQRELVPSLHRDRVVEMAALKDFHLPAQTDDVTHRARDADQHDEHHHAEGRHHGDQQGNVVHAEVVVAVDRHLRGSVIEGDVVDGRGIGHPVVDSLAVRRLPVRIVRGIVRIVDQLPVLQDLDGKNLLFRDPGVDLLRVVRADPVLSDIALQLFDIGLVQLRRDGRIAPVGVHRPAERIVQRVVRDQRRGQRRGDKKRQMHVNRMNPADFFHGNSPAAVRHDGLIRGMPVILR